MKQKVSSRTNKTVLLKNYRILFLSKNLSLVIKGLLFDFKFDFTSKVFSLYYLLSIKIALDCLISIRFIKLKFNLITDHSISLSISKLNNMSSVFRFIIKYSN